MLAILLAGGHATRLWPITRHRAKPLLPIGEGTLLDRLLDQLEPVADRTLVSTNALFADQFQEALQGRSQAELVVEAQASEAEKPGALGAIIQLLEGLPRDEPLLVAGGDNYYGFDLASFAKAASGKDGPTVAVKDLRSRELATQFGIVERGKGSQVDAFHEKPADPPSTLAATALYYYPRGWGDLFDDYEEAARASPEPRKMLDAPGRILEWAVAQGRSVHAWAFEEDWHDIGTAQGYLDALEGILGEGYGTDRLTGCDVGTSVYAFGDAHAADSELERTILLPGAHVREARLRECIVDSEASVHGLSLEDSLVGPHDVLQGPDRDEEDLGSFER